MELTRYIGLSFAVEMGPQHFSTDLFGQEKQFILALHQLKNSRPEIIKSLTIRGLENYLRTDNHLPFYQGDLKELEKFDFILQDMGQKDPFLCRCHKVSYSDAQVASSCDQFIKDTQATKGCGSCVPLVRDIFLNPHVPTKWIFSPEWKKKYLSSGFGHRYLQFQKALGGQKSCVQIEDLRNDAILVTCQNSQLLKNLNKGLTPPLKHFTKGQELAI